MVLAEAPGKAYLEPDEVGQMEAAATNLRDRLLVRVPFRCGCRVSEALGLEVPDIDFDHGTLRIQHLKVRATLACPDCGVRLAKAHRFCPGCSKQIDTPHIKEQERQRMRVIPLDPETMALLQEYVDGGGPVEHDGHLLIFGISRQQAWLIISNLAARAGLPRLLNAQTGREHGISPHRLRDAFAVMAVKADDSGDGLRLLQEMLGHTSFNTTAKYRKVAGTELKEWYGKLWGSAGHDGPRE